MQFICLCCFEDMYVRIRILVLSGAYSQEKSNFDINIIIDILCFTFNVSIFYQQVFW